MSQGLTDAEFVSMLKRRGRDLPGPRLLIGSAQLIRTTDALTPGLILNKLS